MENEIVEGASPKMSPEQLVELSEIVIKRLELGKTIAAPGVTPSHVEVTNVAAEAISKDAQAARQNGQQGRVDYKDPLAQAFEDLARLNKSDFGKYATNKFQDDPQGSLREVWEAGPNVGKPKITDNELGKMFNAAVQMGSQRAKEFGSKEKGIGMLRHFHETGTSAGIIALQKAFESKAFGENNGVLQKALDSTTGSGSDGGFLIRTDLDPFLYEIYLRAFPVWEDIQKYPANGIVHTYNQRTSPGTASFVSELGDITASASASVFSRSATSHIGVMVAYRGVSLKLQYAVRQSGMNYDLSGPNNLEVNGAMTALALLNQTAILQGNYSVSGKTAADEEGLYVVDGGSNPVGFDGLRLLLKPSGTSLNKASNQTYVNVINQAVGAILNAGGDVKNLRIFCSPGAKIAINDEMEAFYREIKGATGPFNSNPTRGGLLNLTDNINQFITVPSNSQGTGTGYYTLSSVATEDLTVIDPSGIGLAHLGSPTPMVLQLPVGFNGALSNVYIIFHMNGLTVPALNFHRKIRIPQQPLLY